MRSSQWKRRKMKTRVLKVTTLRTSFLSLTLKVRKNCQKKASPGKTWKSRLRKKIEELLLEGRVRMEDRHLLLTREEPRDE